MTLMGRKLAAAIAIEGKFSNEGLAALADDDASVEMELAKSLANKLDDTGAERVWAKVAAQPTLTKTVVRNEATEPLGVATVTPSGNLHSARSSSPRLLWDDEPAMRAPRHGKPQRLAAPREALSLFN